MKRNPTYESPAIRTMTMDIESVLCSSLVFGYDGAPGDVFFDEDKINDGGSF